MALVVTVNAGVPDSGTKRSTDGGNLNENPEVPLSDPVCNLTPTTQQSPVTDAPKCSNVRPWPNSKILSSILVGIGL